MSDIKFSISVPEFPGVFGELGGVLLSGTITRGVLRLWFTADRVETPFSKVLNPQEESLPVPKRYAA